MYSRKRIVPSGRLAKVSEVGERMAPRGGKLGGVGGIGKPTIKKHA